MSKTRSGTTSINVFSNWQLSFISACMNSSTYLFGFRRRFEQFGNIFHRNRGPRETLSIFTRVVLNVIVVKISWRRRYRRFTLKSLSTLKPDTLLHGLQIKLLKISLIVADTSSTSIDGSNVVVVLFFFFNLFDDVIPDPAILIIFIINESVVTNPVFVVIILKIWGTTSYRKPWKLWLWFSRPTECYFYRFGQAKCSDGGLVLGSSQFSIMPQLPPKIVLDSKGVKFYKKINISLC